MLQFEFKDVTADVVNRLNKNIPVGDGVNDPNRLPSLKAMLPPPPGLKWLDDIKPRKTSFSVIRSSRISPTRDELFLKLEEAEHAIEFDSYILETNDSSFRPSLFAVSYPKALRKSVNMRFGALSFVVVLNPQLKQNIEKRFGGQLETTNPKTGRKIKTGSYMGYENLGQSPLLELTSKQRSDESLFYPYGWDYLFFELWSKLNYVENPVLSPNFHGYPYQIQASGKTVVLVVPLISAELRLGILTDPGELLNFLEMLEGYILAQQLNVIVDSFPSHSLGSVALAAFSSGNGILKEVLDELRHNSAINEVYMFDPPTYLADAAIDSALNSLKNSWSPILRVYTNSLYPKLNEVTGTQTLATPQIQHNAAGTRSVVFMSQTNWNTLIGTHIKAEWPPQFRALNGIAPSLNNPKDIGAAFFRNNPKASFHQYMPALMLTDALSRSNFR